MIDDMAERRKAVKQNESTAPGWRIRVDIQDEFRRWCDRLNYSYEDECAAAIYLWQHIPAEVREWAKLGVSGDREYGREFWREFFDAFAAEVRTLRRALAQDREKGTPPLGER